ncbi:MAG: type II toxin-antitoxin system RelE/ParE family toxin [Blastocatellales bacterium]
MADSALWSLMEFKTLSGRGVISQWVAKEIEMGAEIEFHSIIRNLQNTPRELWVRPDYAPFDPEIGEIRFKANSLQHRVFGFFLPEAKQYVMLVGCTKKGRIYTPREAEETARNRRRLVLADKGCIHEYKGHKF